jgi:hypothetical protein
MRVILIANPKPSHRVGHQGGPFLAALCEGGQLPTIRDRIKGHGRGLAKELAREKKDGKKEVVLVSFGGARCSMP